MIPGIIIVIVVLAAVLTVLGLPRIDLPRKPGVAGSGPQKPWGTSMKSITFHCLTGPRRRDENIDLIAPCGLNCALCSSYHAFAHQIPQKQGKITHCPGCRPRDKRCTYLKGHWDFLTT